MKREKDNSSELRVCHNKHLVDSADSLSGGSNKKAKFLGLFTNAKINFVLYVLQQR
jgi:hypothetical protein